MGKKSSATTASKISSSTALAKPTNESSAKSSSILRASFAPSTLQLQLFASVIQSFDSEYLRIHDAVTGRLRHQHATARNESITCLDWGYYGPSYLASRQSGGKKRKRAHQAQEDVVVAYGTTSSEICMYSPAEGKIVGRLSGAHDKGIKDFKFNTNNNLEAWSVGGDGKLVQWNLATSAAVRSVSLPDDDVHTLAHPSSSSPQILCASTTPYSIYLDSKDDFRIENYDAFKHPVHTLIRSGTSPSQESECFLAVDNDRYVNVYDVAQKKIVRTLVATGEVVAAYLYRPSEESKDALREQCLALVTREGCVELFIRPFVQASPINGDLKSKRKSLTKKANTIIKLYDGKDQAIQVPALSVNFVGPELRIATTHSGTEPLFQVFRWQDENVKDLVVEGVRQVQRPRPVLPSANNGSSGVKDMGGAALDESRVVVGNGASHQASQDAPIELSSDEEEDAASDDEDVADTGDVDSDTSESAHDDVDMKDVSHDGTNGISKALATTDPDEMDDAEPSFGDLQMQQTGRTITIADAMPKEQNVLAKSSALGQATLPSGMSLGTVLTQSLKTNDQSLLETCLHVTDSSVIQNTILRLDSSLAANLLTKLAERLADRPGRYGHLLVWVQSTMIAHGGAIAGQPNVASKLRTLYQVLNERTRVLPNILLLKGKLDMMNAQHAFRMQAESQRQNMQAIQNVPESVYVEGQDDDWSSEDDLDEEGVTLSTKKASKNTAKTLDELLSDDSDSDSNDDPPTPILNGIHHAKSGDDLIDSQAEESDEGESGSEGGSEDDEADEDEDEEDSEMEDFINDGPISEEEDDDASVDEIPQKAKKRRHK